MKKSKPEKEDKNSELEDGIILLDSERGKFLGFISDKFTTASYLWKKGNEIWISFIESREERKGYFKQLLQNIWDKGYKAVIPTPLGLMGVILRRYGFEKKMIVLDEPKEMKGECCEVWIK